MRIVRKHPLRHNPEAATLLANIEEINRRTDVDRSETCFIGKRVPKEQDNENPKEQDNESLKGW